MMGLMVLGFFAVNLALSIWVVKAASGWAKTNNKKPWLWGGLAAFVMYNLVFWDWIPTVVAHKYYCSTEAGFWVYKTVDQWKKENPGVMETLVEDRVTPPKFLDGSKDLTLIKVVNQRFSWLTIRNRDVISVLLIGREENQLVDTKSNFIIARQVGFGSHDENWGGLKFWLNMEGCASRGIDMTSFESFFSQFKGEKK